MGKRESRGCKEKNGGDEEAIEYFRGKNDKELNLKRGA